ncbi:Cytochrome p450 [Thalictrum thalictroides]|uniref:Cytochrome p450 n=1 Tax=Thalictrum thalictroides TaxID=46969 RepID=A0A7J6W5Z2_THATH|nr:Cytochrome p450 [Thalictrum thalictroides]
MDSLHQYLATIFCCIFASIIFLSLLSRKRRTNIETREAPEPAGAWPLIGHLHMLLPPQPPHITLGSLADKYGETFIVRLGLRRALVVNTWEAAKECFTTNDKIFATRPSSVGSKIMGYNYAMFGLTPYGPYWREVRKISIIELLSNHRLESLKHVRISEVSTSMKELYQLWATSNKNEKGSVLVDMHRWFGDLTLNMSIRMVAGKRYFGVSAELDEHEARRLQQAIKDFFNLLGIFMVSDAIPFLGWLDFSGHEKAMKRTAKEIDSILGRWLEEHKQNKLDGSTKVDGDFMDVMLSVLEDEKLFGYEADIVNKATCLTMIAAGTDTTMVTLIWALSLLVNNQHTLKKAQAEIDMYVGKDKYVEDSDIAKLVYLKAIVKETLRLYPAVPLSVPHEAMEDCTVSGYHVPAGTRLIANLYKIQRDPRIWSNPCEFQPERFLTTHANVDVRGQHFELIPFGSGRRSCPGTSFALQTVYLSLARLLQGFEFLTPQDAPVDMTESPGMTNLKTTPLQVLLNPRLPSHLY